VISLGFVGLPEAILLAGAHDRGDSASMATRRHVAADSRIARLIARVW
jgi:hypothetical protein